MPRGRQKGYQAHPNQSIGGSIGGNLSWARTEDRAARAARMRAHSPSGIAWHARKLGFDPDNLTETQRKRAENARRAYYKRMALESQKARARRKAGNGHGAA